MEENKKLKNPNAFPIEYENGDFQTGMTLRDYFAAKAMAEVPLSVSQRYAQDSDYNLWAEKCYKRADAMLKQRIL